MATTLGKRKAREEEATHGSTLFVSNLPYDATSTDLRTAFSDLAPVRSAFVVLKQGSGVSKGVGYVAFSIKEDAQAAFDSITTNGMTLNGRKVRVQWAERKPKNKTKVLSRAENAKKEKDIPLRNLPVQKVNDPLAIRTTIVSGYSGVGSAHERLGMHEDGSQDEDGEEEKEDNEPPESDSDDESPTKPQLPEEGSQDEDGEKEEEDSGSPESDSDDASPTKPQLPHTDTGNTLFIRNIPFGATEDELRTLFRAFGPLRYVRLAVDHVTERPKGTGFACFWNKEDADKAIEQSEVLRTETMGIQMQPQTNPFSLPSLLTPDPSASVARNLVLHGRTLDVIRAVTREQATKLKEEGEKSREKADKRNLYLLREGVILPNSPAAQTIPQVELEKRINSFNARRAMLRSNPSLYASKTRLSIRQIPLFVTERVLKRLAIHSVREFDAEVQKGIREGLSPDELAEAVEVNHQDVIKTEHDVKPKKRTVKGVRLTSVKQAKIVRQSDRVDPVTGKGRSRGYGFIEMHSHADALRVLRWANNNSDVAALFNKWWKEELADLVKRERTKESRDEARIKRIKDEMEAPFKPAKGTLIVEFSIENIQVVQRRAAQKEKLAQSHKPQKSGSSVEEPPSKKRRVSLDRTKPVQVKEESPKLGKSIGSVIGRKRRARKAGKSAG